VWIIAPGFGTHYFLFGLVGFSRENVVRDLGEKEEMIRVFEGNVSGEYKKMIFYCEMTILAPN
jgi:hypothetical protein